MCGRFVSASTPDELANYFGALAPDSILEGNFNVAPTDEVYVVRASAGERQMASLRWGLIPFWSKDKKIGSKLINARSETVAEKPAFRKAFESRRCILPADGFYEWSKLEGTKKKQPYFVSHPDGEPLVFAGLWERWRGTEAGESDSSSSDDLETLETFTILTCTPNEEMSAIHDRMPVLLAPSAWDDWLAPETEPDSLRSLMVPAPNDFLSIRPVSTAVNNVRNKGPELLELSDPVEVVSQSTLL